MMNTDLRGIIDDAEKRLDTLAQNLCKAYAAALKKSRLTPPERCAAMDEAFHKIAERAEAWRASVATELVAMIVKQCQNGAA